MIHSCDGVPFPPWDHQSLDPWGTEEGEETHPTGEETEKERAQSDVTHKK